MQHSNHLADNGQTLWWNLEPRVKCLDELGTHILARMLVHIVIWAHQDFLIFRRPGAILVFCAIDTRFIALMFQPCGEAVSGGFIGDGFAVTMGWWTGWAICSSGGACPWWNRTGWLKGRTHGGREGHGGG